MSSKIIVTFQHNEARANEFIKVFHIRHLRNHRKNAHGGMELDPFGGYTILSESDTGEMFVAKCNPRTDKFNRHDGLLQAIKSWMKRRHPDYCLFKISALEPNSFVATFDFVATTPF